MFSNADLSPDNAIEHSTFTAVSTVLATMAPQQWPQVAPYAADVLQALDQGHSYIRVDAAAVPLLQAAAPLVGAPGDFVPFVLSGNRLFLGRIWQLEHDIARHLLRLAAAPVNVADRDAAAAALRDWFPEASSRGQQEAAALALLQALMLLNGGPGTGKTTTVAKLLGLLCLGHNGTLPRIALAAPTGKAAARMSQALQQALGRFELPEHIRSHLQTLEGITVHRLLGLRPPMLQARYGPDQPLPLDMVVVDEASMLDYSLLNKLLSALPDGCRLILLGDHNQLPAVGAGDILGALSQETCVSGDLAAQLQQLLPESRWRQAADIPPLAANTAFLRVSHRFDDSSGIGRLARAVVAGDAEAAVAAYADFPAALHYRENLHQAVADLYRLQQDYWQAVAQADVAAAFAAAEQIVVLAARRQDAAAFNGAYRRYLGRHGHDTDAPWFAGQLIMVTQNDYDSRLFNGDIGIVLADAEGKPAAWFGEAGAYRALPLSRLPEHDTAFAITVHKSQGSEYDQVWFLPGEDGHSDRALLYTALTRARQTFVFGGNEAALCQALLTPRPRRSGLRAALAAQAA
ncbi:exodeoxyribonuclease V alpha subunit [Neisseria sp. HSC-16F19]|nr:exodeoxyribonuclease V subunit alpha [Neisseria sp. HSC-16F19]MCP2040467.1 exodeoxyribonuclease V alpha subunit [Neisseria sp. HSC-16F19]